MATINYIATGDLKAMFLFFQPLTTVQLGIHARTMECVKAVQMDTAVIALLVIQGRPVRRVGILLALLQGRYL